MAALAAKVLAGYAPTHVEVLALAGCALAQHAKPSEPKRKAVKRKR